MVDLSSRLDFSLGARLPYIFNILLNQISIPSHQQGCFYSFAFDLFHPFIEVFLELRIRHYFI